MNNVGCLNWCGYTAGPRQSSAPLNAYSAMPRISADLDSTPVNQLTGGEHTCEQDHAGKHALAKHADSDAEGASPSTPKVVRIAATPEWRVERAR